MVNYRISPIGSKPIKVFDVGVAIIVVVVVLVFVLVLVLVNDVVDIFFAVDPRNLPLKFGQNFVNNVAVVVIVVFVVIVVVFQQL